MMEGATEEKGKELRRRWTKRSKKEEAEKKEIGGGWCMMTIGFGSGLEKKKHTRTTRWTRPRNKRSRGFGGGGRQA